MAYSFVMRFTETSVFTKQVTKLLTDDEYHELQKELFGELVESLKEAKQIQNGKLKASRVFNYQPVDVKKIRAKLHISQSQFALMIGVSKATLQNWEQGRRKPEGPAKALLTIVEKNPQAVLTALQA